MSRWRNDSSFRSREMRARAFKCAPAESSGATSRKKRCVGLPSSELKSTPPGLRPKAAITRRRPGSLPCGMATPSPSAVLFSFSRSSSAWTSLARSTSSRYRLATAPASSSMTSPFERPARAGSTRSSLRMSVIFMRPCSAAALPLRLDQTVTAVPPTVEDGHALFRRVGEDEELVARDGELLDRLLDRERLGRHALGADHLGRAPRPPPIRGQHRGRHLRHAAHRRRALVVAALLVQLLRLVLELVYGEVDRRVEVVGLLLGVGLEGRGRVDVPEGHRDQHGTVPSISKTAPLQPGRRGRHRRRSLSVNLLPFRRGEDAHQLAVLGDRPPGDVDLLLAEQLGDVLIAEGPLGVFLGDDPPDLLLDALRRNLGALPAAQARGEEVLDLEGR